jgi:hypothetical protein
MELLKVLAMPFQMSSLLFVAASSLLLGLVTSMGTGLLTTAVLSLFVIWTMLVWMTNFAVRLIDDAANGVRQTSVASTEMLTDPYLDSRCWVHPVLAVALGALHYVYPHWPAWPTLLLATLLFPASIGACVMTGHASDAFNPRLMLQVIQGLSGWYALLVLFLALCALFAVLLVRLLQPGVLLYAGEQLLVLIAYAGIGGVLYERRFELGFDPRISPERAAQRLESERVAQLQGFLDGIYNDLRIRETKRAIANVRQWLTGLQPDLLPGDVHAILAAGRLWTKLREYPRLLQAMVPVLLDLKQPALAYAIAETGLSIDSGFGAIEESDTTALVGYALATGRRRAATQLLDNYLQRGSAEREPGPQLAALRACLHPPA